MSVLKKIIFACFLIIFSFIFPNSTSKKISPVFTREGHYDTVTEVVKYPFGNILLSASNDETIIIWDIANNKIVDTLELYQGPLTSLAVSPGGNYFIAGNERGRVFIFNYATRSLLGSVKLHDGKIAALSFINNENLFISAGLDGNIVAFDLTKNEIIEGISLSSKIISLALSPDKQIIAVGGESGSIYLISSKDFKSISTISNIHSDWITGLAFSPDNKKIASISWDLSVGVFDVATGSKITSFKVNTDKALNSIAWSVDNKGLAISSSDSNIYIYSPESFKLLDILEGHKSKVYKTIFFPNFETIVSAGADARIQVWNMDSKDNKGVLSKIFSGY